MVKERAGWIGVRPLVYLVSGSNLGLVLHYHVEESRHVVQLTLHVRIQHTTQNITHHWSLESSCFFVRFFTKHLTHLW